MDIEEIHDASIFLFVNFDIPFYRITIDYVVNANVVCFK